MATIKKIHDEYYLTAYKSVEAYLLIYDKKHIPFYIYNDSGLVYKLFVGLEEILKLELGDHGRNVSKYFDVNRNDIKENEELQDDWNGLKEYVISICKQKNII